MVVNFGLIGIYTCSRFDLGKKLTIQVDQIGAIVDLPYSDVIGGDQHGVQHQVTVRIVDEPGDMYLHCTDKKIDVISHPLPAQLSMFVFQNIIFSPIPF